VESGEAVEILRRGKVIAEMLAPISEDEEATAPPMSPAPKPRMPEIPGMMRASEIAEKPRRCSFHGCTKMGIRRFGAGWRCEEH